MKILSFSGDDYLIVDPMTLIFHPDPVWILLLPLQKWEDLVLLLLLQKPLLKTQVLFVSKIFCSPLFFTVDVKLTTSLCRLKDWSPKLRKQFYQLKIVFNCMQTSSNNLWLFKIYFKNKKRMKKFWKKKIKKKEKIFVITQN